MKVGLEKEEATGRRRGFGPRSLMSPRRYETTSLATASLRLVAGTASLRFDATLTATFRRRSSLAAGTLATSATRLEATL